MVIPSYCISRADNETRTEPDANSHPLGTLLELEQALDVSIPIHPRQLIGNLPNASPHSRGFLPSLNISDSPKKVFRFNFPCSRLVLTRVHGAFVVCTFSMRRLR